MVVAVFYGGRSCEHDVSIITGIQAAKTLTGHEVVPVYINRKGGWIVPKKYDEIEAYKKGEVVGKSAFMKPDDAYLYIGRGRRFKKIDVALLCVHGLNGEDGTLQGLLKLSGVPFTGSGVGASAAGLNKGLMKRLFSAAGLPVLPFIEAERDEYENALTALIDRAKVLGFPLIVKPTNLGSSIGISVAHDFRELITALNVAFEWDNAVVVERALADFTELNCAVIGRGRRLAESEIERPLGAGEILSYADKYERGGFKGAESGRRFPADIPEELREQVRAYAARAFSALGASGIARVDFLLDNASGELYVNEINTIPGSLALYLFPDPPVPTEFPRLSELKSVEKAVSTFRAKWGAKSGSGSPSTLELLLKLAIEEHNAAEKLKYRYKSPTNRGKG